VLQRPADGECRFGELTYERATCPGSGSSSSSLLCWPFLASLAGDASLDKDRARSPGSVIGVRRAARLAPAARVLQAPAPGLDDVADSKVRRRSSAQSASPSPKWGRRARPRPDWIPMQRDSAACARVCFSPSCGNRNCPGPHAFALHSRAKRRMLRNAYCKRLPWVRRAGYTLG
jgi:hypothetical protein